MVRIRDEDGRGIADDEEDMLRESALGMTLVIFMVECNRQSWVEAGGEVNPSTRTQEEIKSRRSGVQARISTGGMLTGSRA
jgi:hypothetical protein